VSAPAEGSGAPGAAGEGAGPGGAEVAIRAASREDVPMLLGLISELAEYERLADQVVANEELLAAALFGERPSAEALIAELGGEAAGYAIYFPTFSTFLSIQGVWLEDLFVRPSCRKHGVGRALLAAVAARTRERGGQRLEWAALDWNDLALDFYRGLGASRMDEWITHRLVGDELEQLAGQAGSARR
jgi:GNAT superfamily N-acetyltransferase